MNWLWQEFAYLHRCRIAEYPEDSYGIQNAEHQRFIDMSIPRDSDGGYEKCSFYSYTNRTYLMYNSSALKENFTMGDNATLQRCSEWVYEKSVFQETYTSKVFSQRNTPIHFFIFVFTNEFLNEFWSRFVAQSCVWWCHFGVTFQDDILPGGPRRRHHFRMVIR